MSIQTINNNGVDSGVFVKQQTGRRVSGEERRLNDALSRINLDRGNDNIYGGFNISNEEMQAAIRQDRENTSANVATVFKKLNETDARILFNSFDSETQAQLMSHLYGSRGNENFTNMINSELDNPQSKLNTTVLNGEQTGAIAARALTKGLLVAATGLFASGSTAETAQNRLTNLLTGEHSGVFQTAMRQVYQKSEPGNGFISNSSNNARDEIERFLKKTDNPELAVFKAEFTHSGITSSGAVVRADKNADGKYDLNELKSMNSEQILRLSCTDEHFLDNIEIQGPNGPLTGEAKIDALKNIFTEIAAKERMDGVAIAVFVGATLATLTAGLASGVVATVLAVEGTAMATLTTGGVMTGRPAQALENIAKEQIASGNPQQIQSFLERSDAFGRLGEDRTNNIIDSLANLPDTKIEAFYTAVENLPPEQRANIYARIAKALPDMQQGRYINNPNSSRGEQIENRRSNPNGAARLVRLNPENKFQELKRIMDTGTTIELASYLEKNPPTKAQIARLTPDDKAKLVNAAEGLQSFGSPAGDTIIALMRETPDMQSEMLAAVLNMDTATKEQIVTTTPSPKSETIVSELIIEEEGGLTKTTDQESVLNLFTTNQNGNIEDDNSAPTNTIEENQQPPPVSANIARNEQAASSRNYQVSTVTYQDNPKSSETQFIPRTYGITPPSNGNGIEYLNNGQRIMTVGNDTFEFDSTFQDNKIKLGGREYTVQGSNPVHFRDNNGNTHYLGWDAATKSWTYRKEEGVNLNAA
ncbi:hypothetical protein NO1_0417 [Candidatus Termititenax aidoneus]|uniref:Uncharacterized protein n=1 Tax=Termititenax aidoneus TaxID=2218524 RepID=A0A388T8L9_TERA1|nr:hypothetical protein NO1_0417 [Candidatus Termititenax aidoneus]